MRQTVRWLAAGFVLVSGSAMLLAGCGGDDEARADSGSTADMVSVEFPHFPGARQIAGEEVGDEALPFAGADAVATLHVVDGERAMTIASHYGVDIGDGWTLRGGPQTEFIAYRLLEKGDRIAMLTMVPGEVASSMPDVMEGVDLAPFNDAVDDVGDDETLIYSLIATCRESQVDSCIQKAAASQLASSQR